MEEARLKRMHFLDKAGIFELEGRMESAETRDYRSQIGYLGRKGRELVNAQAEGERLLDLFYERKNLRLTLRGLNIFLTAIMEGRIAEGQEAFSDFLILLAGNIAVVPEQYIKVLGLYIRLSYGDNKTARAIPFEFSRKAGLFPAEVALLTDQTTRKTREKRTAFEEDYQKKEWASFHSDRENKRYFRRNIEYVERKLLKRVLLREPGMNIVESGFSIEEYTFSCESIYKMFMWFEKSQSLQDMLAPYYGARFNEEWRQCVIHDPNDLIRKIKREFAEEFERDKDRYERKTIKRLNAFLEKYGEGALVVFALLDAPRFVRCIPNVMSFISVFLRYWNKNDSYYEFVRMLSHEMKYLDETKMEYRNYSMLDFPGIAGREPLDIFLFVNKFKQIEMNRDYRRKDITECKKLFQERFNYFAYERPSAARTWNSCDLITREYLFTRACDLVQFGEDVADLTFPEPANSDYRWVVSSLVWLFDERQKQLAKEKDDEEEAEKRERIEKDCAWQVEKIICRPPDTLALRVLDAGGIRMVRETCINEFMQAGEQTRRVVETIDNFVVFCRNLNKPENHIMIKTWQYIKREYNTRQEADMVNEVSRLLTSLPKYTAYAKIVTESGGEAGVWKGTVRTLELTEAAADAAEKACAAIEANMSAYTKPREQIREEIEKRQARWRQRSSAEEPSVRIKEKKQENASVQKVPERKEAPPPISFPSRKTPEKQEPVKSKTADNPKEPEEKGLIYRSNFYLSDDKWTEKETTDIRKFRRDGYYHIELNRSYTTAELIEIPVTDFKVYVDAQALKGGNKASYGVVFRYTKDSDRISFYLFSINSDSYALLFYSNNEYRFLMNYRSSEFIKQDSINSLMVQMEGQEITLGVNGHILANVTDNCLTSGYVGLFVRKEGGSLVAARFRNFRLYSLE